MKQTLLTLCLIVFALPSLGETTFSSGNISGGKVSNEAPECKLSNLDEVLYAPKAENYVRKYNMNSNIDKTLSKRKTVNPFLAWNYNKIRDISDYNYYGIAWQHGVSKRKFPQNPI